VVLNMDCEQCATGSLMRDAKELYIYNIYIYICYRRFSGSTGDQIGERWHRISKHIYHTFFYEKEVESGELGTGFLWTRESYEQLKG
jgi:hypothetical protein